MFKNPRANLHSRKGFTLVELIVGLVILGIMAAIAVPALTRYIDNGRQQSVLAEAHAAVTATQTLCSSKYQAGGFDDPAEYLRTWYGNTGATGTPIYAEEYHIYDGNTPITRNQASLDAVTDADNLLHNAAPDANGVVTVGTNNVVPGDIIDFTCDNTGMVTWLVYKSGDTTVVYSAAGGSIGTAPAAPTATPAIPKPVEIISGPVTFTVTVHYPNGSDVAAGTISGNITKNGSTTTTWSNGTPIKVDNCTTTDVIAFSGIAGVDPAKYTVATPLPSRTISNTDFNKTINITINLNFAPIDVNFRKVIKDTTTDLAGAKLQLTGNGVGFDTKTWTSSNANTTYPLPAGSYVLTELSAPDGYETAEPIHFSVADNADASALVVKLGDDILTDNTITMEDEISSLGAVKLWAVDENDDTIAGLPLYIPSHEPHRVTSGKFTAPSIALKSGDLGDTLTARIDRSNDFDENTNYDLTKAVKFKVNGDGTLTYVSGEGSVSGNNVYITCVRKTAPLRDLKIFKKDHDGDALAGAKLALYDESGTQIGVEMTSDSSTESITKQQNSAVKLEYGVTYTLKETAAPTGYIEAADTLLRIEQKDGKGHLIVNGVDKGEYKDSELNIINEEKSDTMKVWYKPDSRDKDPIAFPNNEVSFVSASEALPAVATEKYQPDYYTYQAPTTIEKLFTEALQIKDGTTVLTYGTTDENGYTVTGYYDATKAGSYSLLITKNSGGAIRLTVSVYAYESMLLSRDGGTIRLKYILPWDFYRIRRDDNPATNQNANNNLYNMHFNNGNIIHHTEGYYMAANPIAVQAENKLASLSFNSFSKLPLTSDEVVEKNTKYVIDDGTKWLAAGVKGTLGYWETSSTDPTKTLYMERAAYIANAAVTSGDWQPIQTWAWESVNQSFITINSKWNEDTSTFLPGIEYQIMDEHGSPVDEWASDGTPHHITLPAGNYTLLELLPSDNYVTNEANGYTITVPDTSVPQETDLKYSVYVTAAANFEDGSTAIAPQLRIDRVINGKKAGFDFTENYYYSDYVTQWTGTTKRFKLVPDTSSDTEDTIRLKQKYFFSEFIATPDYLRGSPYEFTVELKNGIFQLKYSRGNSTSCFANYTTTTNLNLLITNKVDVLNSAVKKLYEVLTEYSTGTAKISSGSIPADLDLSAKLTAKGITDGEKARLDQVSWYFVPTSASAKLRVPATMTGLSDQYEARLTVAEKTDIASTDTSDKSSYFYAECKYNGTSNVLICQKRELWLDGTGQLQQPSNVYNRAYADGWYIVNAVTP